MMDGYWPAMVSGDLDVLRKLLVSDHPEGDLAETTFEGSPLFAAAWLGHDHVCRWILTSRECGHMQALDSVAQAIWSALYASAVEGNHSSEEVTIFHVGEKGMNTAYAISLLVLPKNKPRVLRSLIDIAVDFLANSTSNALYYLVKSLAHTQPLCYRCNPYNIYTHFAVAICEFLSGTNAEVLHNIEDALTELVVNILTTYRASCSKTLLELMTHLSDKFPFVARCGKRILESQYRSLVLEKKRCAIPVMFRLGWVAAGAALAPLSGAESSRIEIMEFLVLWYIRWFGKTREMVETRRDIMNYSACFRDLTRPQTHSFDFTGHETKMTQLYRTLLQVHDREFVDVVAENLRFSSLFSKIGFCHLVSSVIMLTNTMNQNRRMGPYKEIGSFPTSKAFEIDVLWLEWKVATQRIDTKTGDSIHPMNIIRNITALYRYSDAHNAPRIMTLYLTLKRRFPDYAPPLANLYVPYMRQEANHWLVWSLDDSAEPYVRERHFRLAAKYEIAQAERIQMLQTYKYMRSQFELKKILRGKHLTALTNRPLPILAARTIIQFL
jgi:hypothetical protein